MTYGKGSIVDLAGHLLVGGGQSATVLGVRHTDGGAPLARVRTHDTGHETTVRQSDLSPAAPMPGDTVAVKQSGRGVVVHAGQRTCTYEHYGTGYRHTCPTRYVRVLSRPGRDCVRVVTPEVAALGTIAARRDKRQRTLRIARELHATLVGVRDYV